MALIYFMYPEAVHDEMITRYTPSSGETLGEGRNVKRGAAPFILHGSVRVDESELDALKPPVPTLEVHANYPTDIEEIEAV